MHQLNFLTLDQIEYIKNRYRTPCYVYSENKLKTFAQTMLDMPNAFWLKVRFAMKANSNANILRIFKNMGIGIDASSEYEAYRAVAAGVAPEDIQISGQELSEDLQKLLDTGVFFVATSLRQLEEVGKLGYSKPVGVRINPGAGSGAFAKISTGGATSGFGIWHEYIGDIQAIASRYDLNISKIHLHIGSENSPEAWMQLAQTGLEIVKGLDSVETLNLGGGFKMAIMPYEKTADIQGIGEFVKSAFEKFALETGRKITLEVEPGKFLVINSCSVIAKVVDMTDTGKDGYKFIKLNSGMTEMPRVPMYGVQEPIIVINDSREMEDYVVIGHCCESGDLLTCKLYEPETIEPRTLNKAQIWDMVVIEGTGAYNASMSTKNYNSYPEAGEIMIKENGEIVEIRARERPEEIWRNEIIR